jgi:hypothetical protein
MESNWMEAEAWMEGEVAHHHRTSQVALIS